MPKNRNANNQVKIEINSRRGVVPDDDRESAIEKAAKLVRFHRRISSIQIVSDDMPDMASVEIIVHVDSGATLVAKEEASEFRPAVDRLLAKMERQLKKDNEKRKNHKGDAPKEVVSPPEVAPDPEESYEDIVRRDLDS